jgi:hypothetical protein
MSKFLLNLLVIISESLAKFQIHLNFKNQFLLNLLLGSGPTHPMLAYPSLLAAASPLSPADLRGLGAFIGRALSFWLCAFRYGAYSLPQSLTCGPHMLALSSSRSWHRG